MIALHIGCGENDIKGWVNIDLVSTIADRQLDVRGGLPYEDTSVSYIYSEHFVEHLTVAEAQKVFREFHRVLASDGIVRIATPDLRYILRRYFFGWKRQEWIKKYGFEWIKTPAEMVNVGMREWGHQYLYDEQELRRRLLEAGFDDVRRERLGRSSTSMLKNLETRADSHLILEAVK